MGLTLASRLAAAEVDVYVIARRREAAARLASGLVAEDAATGATRTHRVRAGLEVPADGPILVCTRCDGLEPATRQIASAAPGVPVVTFQNDVDNEERAARRLRRVHRRRLARDLYAPGRRPSPLPGRPAGSRRPRSPSRRPGKCGRSGRRRNREPADARRHRRRHLRGHRRRQVAEALRQPDECAERAGSPCRPHERGVLRDQDPLARGGAGRVGGGRHPDGLVRRARPLARRRDLAPPHRGRPGCERATDSALQPGLVQPDPRNAAGGGRLSSPSPRSGTGARAGRARQRPRSRGAARCARVGEGSGAPLRARAASLTGSDVRPRRRLPGRADSPPAADRR